MNLKKKKYKLGTIQKNYLEKKFLAFTSTTINQKIKCSVPVFTNKIKPYTFEGFITHTHRKKNNLNQTYSFATNIAKSIAYLTVPAQSPLLKIYPLE